MDAKSKADFINSVSAGETIPCPKCNTANKSDDEFCISCGTKLTGEVSSNEDQALAPISGNSQQIKEEIREYVEPESVFAEGLPSWDIVPPQVMVRRRQK